MLIPNTNIKGMIAVKAFKGDINGILCIIVINKKYRLGKRENCMSKPLGINVNKLYLVVVIVLSFK